MRLLLATLALSLSLPVRAEVGLTGGSTLARSVSPRAIAMGEAFSAVAGDLDSLGYNPAGLSGLAQPELMAQYTHGIVDDSFGSFSYAHPTPFGSLWAGLSYYDAGSIHLQLSDGTDTTARAAQDFVYYAGAAVKLPGGLSVGATAKAYRFELAERAKATGFAADGGALWKTPLKGLSFGASARNLGPDVKYEQVGDPLPTEYRAGAAYAVEFKNLSEETPYSSSQFMLTADGVFPQKNKAMANVGGEMRLSFSATGWMALRCGYIFNSDPGSLNLGVGFKEGHFLFDYAASLKRDVGNVNHFAIGVLF
jgi:hypothetical protein